MANPACPPLSLSASSPSAQSSHSPRHPPQLPASLSPGTVPAVASQSCGFCTQPCRFPALSLHWLPTTSSNPPPSQLSDEGPLLAVPCPVGSRGLTGLSPSPCVLQPRLPITSHKGTAEPVQRARCPPRSLEPHRGAAQLWEAVEASDREWPRVIRGRGGCCLLVPRAENREGSAGAGAEGGEQGPWRPPTPEPVGLGLEGQWER